MVEIENNSITVEIPDNIKRLMEKLFLNNYDAYIIGGAVRDAILGRIPHDYDIFTNASGEQILKLFPKGKVIGNDDRQKKILTVIVDGVEISQYRANGDRTEVGNDLTTHLSTCDFTMNAIACNIKGELIDYHHGAYNIGYKTIKCVGDEDDRFKEDPLRILRAIRQSSQLDFIIHHKTYQSIERNTHLLKTISKERIKDEFIKMQGDKRIYAGLLEMGVLDLLVPEHKHIYKLYGGDYHDEDVHIHCNNAYRISCDLTSNYRIHMAAYFHDIGKGIKIKKDKEGKISFIGHQQESSKIAEKFMRKYKFSNKDIIYVTTMIEHHMMGGVDKLRNNTIINIFNELESAGISIEDMLIMTYCDNQGNEAKPRCKFNEFYQNNNWLRKIYKLKYERMPFKITDLVIGGKDCMNIGLKGKEIGEKLTEIFNLVIEGEITNDRHILLEYLHR